MKRPDAPWDDVERFIAYLVRILPTAITKEPRVDEKDLEPSLKFMDKVLLVVQCLINHDCRRQAFQLMVFLKTLHGDLRHTPRLFQSDSLSCHQELTRLVRNYVNGTAAGLDEPPSWSTITNEKPLSRHLVFPEDPDRRRCTYLGFASIARTLRKQYAQVQAENCCWKPLGNNSCFLKASVDFLGWLQKKAWSENRYKIFCTVGTILPAEITEQIFEQSLISEEIPQDPRVEETDPERIALTEAMRSTKARQEHRVLSRHRNEKMVKELYYCGHMERRSDPWSDSDSGSDSD